MEKILAENLLDEIIRLTPEQKIFINFPNEVCDKLELLIFQIKSMENLFQSYINNTSDVANELNMEKFLNKYVDLAREKETLFKDNVLKCFGLDVYNYCTNRNNNIIYSLDFKLNKLVIIKIK